MISQLDGLVQEWRNSTVLAMELCLSCTNPSNYSNPHIYYIMECSPSCILLVQTLEMEFIPFPGFMPEISNMGSYKIVRFNVQLLENILDLSGKLGWKTQICVSMQSIFLTDENDI